MKPILCVDFGSTYTKITAFDLLKEDVVGTARAPSTVETDIVEGYKRARAALKKETGLSGSCDVTLACSSAAGGLKMVAIGLVPELTAEAAKRAALGAGARVLGTLGFELDGYEIAEIREMRPDIILLAGGTDGGNKGNIIHNARMIAEGLRDLPIVVAGNKKAREEIEDIFTNKGIYYRISENVMPRLNVLNVEPVRETIRQLFIEKIVEAKGMKKVEETIGSVIMPTPAAVLKAVRCLAEGTDNEDGLGDLAALDVGGATTDVYSLSKYEVIKAGVTKRGLPEPYAKRTVEGDLGMRVSALSLWTAAGSKLIREYDPGTAFDIEERCRYLAQHVESLPSKTDEKEFDEALCCTAVQLAMDRHAGFIENQYTPVGLVYIQEGKDLQDVKYLIGSGGVIVNSENPSRILQSALDREGKDHFLKPLHPQFLVDRKYILSASGLLANRFPDKALRILKKYLVSIN